MAQILPQIRHMVVVMLENRSFDNICGWLYSDPKQQPSIFLPPDSPKVYAGLNPDLWNPSNADYFNGQPAKQVRVVKGTTSHTVPDPDPEETFDNVTYQLYGPQAPGADPKWPMQGFVVNYEKTKAGDPDQIMQTYSPDQVPVISALARNYAVSDAWFCSVPSQTWPNRAFVHAGTSNGNVNNGEFPDPFCWDVRTIFNVLSDMGVDWKVYSDALVAPSLTRTMFPKLWDPLLDGQFQHFSAFQEACATNSLPRYSFVEPSFLLEPNDEHPPHDVSAGEQFLQQIWQAVSNSPGWENILLVITYDEHGGCYDHVLPALGATPPDAASRPGHENFSFDRFGVRVPMVVVSPYIQAGTVFRSDAKAQIGVPVPYDHTSILATLRDWVGIPESKMLGSARIQSAPNLGQVLTLASPRSDKPNIAATRAAVTQAALTLPPNDLQRSIIAGSARRFGMDPRTIVPQLPTRQDAVNFFRRRQARAHA